MEQYNPGLVELQGIMDEVEGLMDETGAIMRPVAPIRQRLQVLAARPQALPPAVQPIIRTVTQTLSAVHNWQSIRRMENLLSPTTPVTVCFDALTSGSLSVTAIVKAPYTGKPWELLALEANDRQVQPSGASFRFPVIRIGGINFADPSAQQVSYPAGNGTPTSPGLDLITISAHNKVSRPENRWRPWTGQVFTSDATVEIAAYNGGTATGSVMVNLMCKANPCDVSFAKNHMVALADLNAARADIRGSRFSVRGF